MAGNDTEKIGRARCFNAMLSESDFILQGLQLFPRGKGGDVATVEDRFEGIKFEIR